MTSTTRELTTWITAAILLLACGAAAQETRGTISGMVVAPAGMPQPTVTLVLTNLATGIDRRLVSEPTGEFVFGGLTPGTYRLRLDAEELFAPWSQDSIVITAGVTVPVRVELQPRVPVDAPETQRGTISGTVIGPDGRPRAGVVAIITNAQGIDRRAVTEPGGGYVFGGLTPGNYRLRVDTDDQGTVDVGAFIVNPGEQRQVDVRLQPPVLAFPRPGATPAAPMAPPAPRDTPPVASREARSPEPAAIIVPATTSSSADGEFEAKPDRWQFDFPDYQRYVPGQGLPFVDGNPFDPYNQNTAKADFPIAGSTFLNLNLQGNSNVNPRRVAINAPQDQVFFNQNFVAGLELFGGSTVFEPKRWAVRGTIVANYNANAVNSLNLGELTQRFNLGDVDEVGVEELFVEKRLAVTSPAFDFITVRGGMQNFNADFRGYLFADNQLGVRLFGNARSNRDQFNVAYFSMRNRDAASQLHDFTNRNQDVVLANYYIQDAGAEGYTLMFGGALNRDRGPAADPVALNVMYAGVHGDGRWGSWAVSHAFYEAFGTDDDNRIVRALGAPGPAAVDVRARMAAIELSRDADWLRYRLSALYASGDDATDLTVTGFDAITENPNLAGGQFMFWTQQTTKVDGLPHGELLSEKFTLMPSLRSKFTDRANFANPGLILLNGGLDLRLSPQLKLVTNASWLQFADASVLRVLRGARGGFEDEQIGLDLSAGAKWRPALNENLFVVPGISVLMPRGGFAAAIGSDRPLFSIFTAIQLAY